MSTYTRTTKSNGTTEWAQGETITHTEHNDEWNTFLNDYNGGITTANLSGSAGITNAQLADIEPTKVLDYSANITEISTNTSPGDTATPDLPTELRGELLRLRYRSGAARGYQSNVFYMNSSAVATAAAWFEPHIVGPNLLPNPGFEVFTGTSTDAPDGWSLVGTPSSIAIENPAYTGVGLEKRSLNIVTDADDEGISVDVAGLKAGTKYLIGMEYTLTDNGTVAGSLKLSTTNGLASGNYQNLSLVSTTEAASTVVVYQGIVKSQSPAVTMTVSITGTKAGLDVNLINVWMYELAEDYPRDLPSLPVQIVEDSTEDTAVPSTFTSSQWNWETWTPLSLSQYVPFQGYRLTYEVTISYKATGTNDDVHMHGFRIQVDGVTAAGPYIEYTDADATANFENGHIITLRHVLDNPAPGATYAFTVDVGAYNGGTDHSQITMNPIVPATTGLQSVSTARLIPERL